MMSGFSIRSQDISRLSSTANGTIPSPSVAAISPQRSFVRREERRKHPPAKSARPHLSSSGVEAEEIERRLRIGSNRLGSDSKPRRRQNFSSFLFSSFNWRQSRMEVVPMTCRKTIGPYAPHANVRGNKDSEAAGPPKLIYIYIFNFLFILYFYLFIYYFLVENSNS